MKSFTIELVRLEYNPKGYMETTMIEKTLPTLTKAMNYCLTHRSKLAENEAYNIFDDEKSNRIGFIDKTTVQLTYKGESL